MVINPTGLFQSKEKKKLLELKVSKSQKQFFLASHTLKIQLAELLQGGIFFPHPFICTSRFSNEKVRNQKN